MVRHPRTYSQKWDIIKKDEAMGNAKYTCNDYREEMILAGLRKRAASQGLSEKEKAEILKEIKKIEEKREGEGSESVQHQSKIQKQKKRRKRRSDSKYS